MPLIYTVIDSEETIEYAFKPHSARRLAAFSLRQLRGASVPYAEATRCLRAESRKSDAGATVGVRVRGVCDS